MFIEKTHICVYIHIQIYVYIYIYVNVYMCTLNSSFIRDAHQTNLPDSSQDLEDGWAGYFLSAESADGHEVKCSFITDDGYFESARVAAARRVEQFSKN